MNRQDARQLAVKGITANPGLVLSQEQLAALNAPAGDISFDDLGFDSLGRMELSIWLELECALELTEEQVRELGSLEGLTGLLARHLQ